MFNFVKKPTAWILASLLVASSMFGQNSNCGTECPKPECAPKCCPPPCPQPCPPKQVCPPCPPAPCCPPWYTPVLNAAYNYPSRTETRCSWDIDIDAGFLYWQPIQENMELGMVVQPSLFAPTLTGAANTNPVYVNTINMDFKYKPGFTVSFGWDSDFDDWDIQADYYWFHNKHSQSTFDCNFVSGVSNYWTNGGILPKAGSPYVEALKGTVYQSASQTWKLGMDIVDLDIGRWYYVGRKLTFRPSFGGRAAFIHQNLKVSYLNGSDLVTPSTGASTGPFSAYISAKSHSWAVGPKAAIETNWMLGSGWRLFGNGEADLLFTRYTKLSTKVSSTVNTVGANSLPENVYFSQKKVNALRTHLDLELGLGWGTYFDCNNWYLDFAAGYEFQVFFDQNMFRNYISSGSLGFSSSPNGNLYVHGLTATVRLDF